MNRTFCKCLIPAVIVGLPLASAATAQHRPTTRPQKVSVRFLARSTSIRSSWAGNQDIYFVEITEKKGTAPVFARLIDDFFDADTAVPQEVLDAHVPVTIGVQRWRVCDLRYADFEPHLTTMEYGGFVLPGSPPPPGTLPALSADTRIPCYKAVHKSIDWLAQ